jgi:hypothetical protein
MSDDVRLRDVEEPDLEVFFEHQVDPEAARLANFPSRDREPATVHWTSEPSSVVATTVADSSGHSSSTATSGRIGHAQVSTTLDIYVTTHEAQDADAAERVAAVILGADVINR